MVKIIHEGTSAKAAAKLILDDRMPGVAPLQAVQELVYVGEACVSSDANCRPLVGLLSCRQGVGCSAAGRDRVVPWRYYTVW